AALLVLRALDEADGHLELVADLVVLGHAVDFAEEEGGEAMAVHGAVGLVGGDEAGFLGGIADELDALGDVLAVLAAAGEVAGGHEGEARQAGDAGGGGVAAEGAVGLLGLGEPVQAPGDGELLFVGDLVAADLVGFVGDAGGVGFGI